MYQAISAVASSYYYVSSFVRNKKAFDTQAQGDMPNMTERLELSMGMLFSSLAVLELVFPVTTLIRGIVTASVAALFFLESLLRYGKIQKSSLYRLWYPATMFFVVVFYPTITAFLLLICARILGGTISHLVFGYTPEQERDEGKRSKGRFSLLIHELILNLTTVISLTTFSALLYAYCVATAATIAQVSTIVFCIVYILRDFGLYATEANQALSNITEYIQLFIWAEQPYGWIPLIMAKGGDFVGAIFGLFVSTNPFLAYKNITISKEEHKSYADAVLNHRQYLKTAKDIEAHYHITPQLMMGSAYNFKTQCSETPDIILDRVWPLLKDKLPDDYKLKVEASTEAFDVDTFDKNRVLKELRETVDQIVNEQGLFVGFKDMVQLKNTLSQGLIGLEEALKKDDLVEASDILETIIAEKAACPPGVFGAYKTAFLKYSGNLGYLVDLESQKYMDMRVAYSMVKNAETGSLRSALFKKSPKKAKEYVSWWDWFFKKRPEEKKKKLSIFERELPMMKWIHGTLSPHDNEDRHSYHNYCIIFSDGHHTISHEAAFTDDGSICADPESKLSLFVSRYAVSEFIENKIKKYLGIITPEAIKQLYEKRTEKLASTLSLKQLQSMYSEKVFIFARDELKRIGDAAGELNEKGEGYPNIVEESVTSMLPYKQKIVDCIGRLREKKEDSQQIIPELLENLTGMQEALFAGQKKLAAKLKDDAYRNKSIEAKDKFMYGGIESLETIADEFSEMAGKKDGGEDIQEDLKVHLDRYWENMLSRAVLFNELVSVGYIAKTKNIIVPCFKQSFYYLCGVIKGMFRDFYEGCFGFASDVSLVTLNVIKAPAKAADIGIRRARVAMYGSKPVVPPTGPNLVAAQ